MKAGYYALSRYACVVQAVNESRLLRLIWCACVAQNMNESRLYAFSRYACVALNKSRLLCLIWRAHVQQIMNESRLLRFRKKKKEKLAGSECPEGVICGPQWVWFFHAPRVWLR
jgi:hypothetical protein